jgi:hypothetical protein
MPDKNFQNIVAPRKKSWTAKWLEAVMSSYPKETARFLRDTADPFANPVGATLKTGIGNLFDVLAADSFDDDAVRQALNPIIRIRSIQEMSPSAALEFITRIKSIMADDVKFMDSSPGGQPAAEKIISERADRALLIAFDLYMECVKHIYTLRAKQASNGVRQLLIKKDLISELPDTDLSITE